jgi:alpha-L-fucosidase
MCLPLTLALAAAVQVTTDVPPPAPFGPVPSARQLAWHERQFYGFVHFGPNTFTGVEWGEGREDPKLFAPSALDCRQWVRAMKAAGMTGVILTAKHHDGFCLFVSEHTTHDVESAGTPRDVLKELSEACKAEQMWLGVYLSPWDRREPRYGSGDAYNEHFRAQLREALTKYGDVAEVWFDGACGEGPNGKVQVYDWPSFVQVVRELQPDACIFSDAGPDVRWCGNERAIGSETNWALLRRDEVYPGYPDYHELGPGHEDGTHWVPYECNTSIRPGWFWKAGLDAEVKSLEVLVDTWYASVGRSGNFLLNCPPDDRGRLPDVDVARLAALGRVLKATFDVDVLRTAAEGPGVGFLASNVRGKDEERFGPIGLLDDDRGTYWATDDGVTKGHVELRFEEPITFDNVWLEEAIQLGQRITAWRVEAAVDDAWQRVAEGTTVGARRVLRTRPTTTKKLRLYVDSAKACPTVARLALFLSPPRVELSATGGTYYERAEVSASTRPSAVVRYTRDGSDPNASSPELEGPLVLRESVKLALRGFEGNVGSPFVARAEFVVLTERDALEPIHFIRAPDPGFAWRRYDQRFQSVAQFCDPRLAALLPPPDAEGRVAEVGVEPASKEPCALIFEGHLSVAKTGLWRFATTSDDGSRVWIGDHLVVDNDGLHGATRAEGAAVLKPGYYPIRVAYFDAGGGRELKLEARAAAPGAVRD